MRQLTLQQIQTACDGQLLGGQPDAVVCGVCTDTRTLHPGDLFVALMGEAHDGHDYVASAAEAGAIGAVVSRSVDAGCPLIKVKDTLVAYGRIGALCREGSQARFLAVTGSAGKTTTKDLLGSIVSVAGNALVAPGTQNNEVGVPKLLIGLSPEHEFCVLELAMRGPGEIKYLSDICQPHVGIVTNVGDAHVGRLGSREAIAKTKAELITSLPADGVAVLNADDFFFGLMGQMAPCPVGSFGSGEAPTDVVFHVQYRDVRATGVEPARFELCIGEEKRRVRLQIPGAHNVSNAAAAAAAAHAVGISLSEIAAGLEGFSGSDMRSEVVRAPGGFTIINDTYNASPTSTPVALGLLAECSGRKVFVFGDMLELGETAERAHRQIGKTAVACGVDWVITVGPLAALAAEDADAAGIQANAVDSVEEALLLLEGALEEGDTLLVKASRAMALERVVKGLVPGA